MARALLSLREDTLARLDRLKAVIPNLFGNVLRLDRLDRDILRAVCDKFGGGPVGLNSLAAAIGEEKDAIEDIYEPYLIQIGFLDRTARGLPGALGALMRLAMFLVQGQEKREAVGRLLGGEDIPASRVGAERVLILADPAAAGRAA